jgi:uncharacterized RDD family membrane protein YckC
VAEEDLTNGGSSPLSGGSLEGAAGRSAPGYPPYSGAWPAQGAWPAPYAAPGWTAPQGQWGSPTPYQPTGWEYRPPSWGAAYGAPAYGAPTYGVPAYVPPGPEPGFEWGGIGARFGALVIDAIIIIVALFAAGLVISGFAPASSSSGSESPEATAVSLIWMLFALVYHPVFWYLFGATPGQKALGLRVAQASSGAPLGLSGVLARYLIFFFVTIAIPLGIISAVMAAQDPFKRAWHDEVARSIVVRRR